jgi:hypothetical protein
MAHALVCVHDHIIIVVIIIIDNIIISKTVSVILIHSDLCRSINNDLQVGQLLTFPQHSATSPH